MDPAIVFFGLGLGIGLPTEPLAASPAGRRVDGR
jgi:hypothetical protein